MARIAGAIGTSHIPAIGLAIERGQQSEPYWKPFFDGYPPVHRWLERVRPDLAVIFYNDHGLNFFLDKLPTFAVGAAPAYQTADEGWGLKPLTPFEGDAELSWHVIEQLVAAEFDVTTCQEMKLDHGAVNPMALLWPGGGRWPVKLLPIHVNTVQHPLPSPARCYRFGQVVGRALASYPRDLRIVVIGSGGLSHQLEGRRAGFINREFDLMCLEKIVAEPEALLQYSSRDLVRLAGSQGVELLCWLMMRGALEGPVKRLHSNYHIPISNTAAATLLLEQAA